MDLFYRVTKKNDLKMPKQFIGPVNVEDIQYVNQEEKKDLTSM